MEIKQLISEDLSVVRSHCAFQVERKARRGRVANFFFPLLFFPFPFFFFFGEDLLTGPTRSKPEGVQAMEGTTRNEERQDEERRRREERERLRRRRVGWGRGEKKGKGKRRKKVERGRVRKERSASLFLVPPARPLRPPMRPSADRGIKGVPYGVRSGIQYAFRQTGFY